MIRILIIYSLIWIAAIAAFFSFRPFTIIDHLSSKIVCEKNQASYPLGPNLFYLLKDRFDNQTEKNVRKLCAYNIINDFQDTYKTPETTNYRISKVIYSIGDWGDSVLMAVTIWIIGIGFMLYLNKLFKIKFDLDLKLLILALPVGMIIFIIFLKSPSQKFFCQRYVSASLNDFKRAGYGYGLARIQQEEAHIKVFLNYELSKCSK